MKNPCRGCEERVAEPNCHMVCERYLEYRRVLDAQGDERHRQIEVNAYMASVSDNIRRYIRRTNKLRKRTPQ